MIFQELVQMIETARPMKCAIKDNAKIRAEFKDLAE